MSLPLPDLDDRRWADLVDEGRTLIPVVAPGWTDHNVHDPGITFMELFAWIAETDMYRLDRIPAERYRKFLALVGVEPEPPRGAVTAVAFELRKTAPATLLPAGIEVEGADPIGVAVRFRTRRDVHAVAGSLEALWTRDEDVMDLTERRRRGEVLALFGRDPGPGSALYLGLDLPQGVPGKAVSLFFDIEDAGTGTDERERLVEELARAREACRAAPSLLSCGDEAESPETAAGDDPLPVHHSAHLVWEVHAGAGHWRRVDAVRDATRAFTLSGAVEVRLPAGMVPVRLGPVARSLYYLRCRLLTGAFDAAPEAAAVLLNGVVAEQEARVVDEGLGTGAGLPGQRLRLGRPLVCGREIEVATLEDGVTRSVLWTERPDFLASGRDDAHFVADRGTGDLVFGDGEHGRTVPWGAAVGASYCTTRGQDGNLQPGSVDQLSDTVYNRSLVAGYGIDFDALAAKIDAVRQPLDARGGSSGETLDEAASRAFDLVESSPRVVTLGDYEERARQTPGVRLARVAARANLHPAFPCLRAPGVITVIVVPHLPARRPVPSPGLQRAVAAWLDARRPLGTRLEVVGPTWVEVTVRATVRACRGVDRAGLAERLRADLDAFFHPLTGGPDGTGWPFGRDVYRSEVLQVLDETPGADHVLALELLDRDGGPPSGERRSGRRERNAPCPCPDRRAAGERSSCGNLCVPPNGLVAAGAHEITVRSGELP